MINLNYPELLNQLCELLLNYSQTFRATTQFTTLANFQSQFPDLPYDPNNKLYRESLLEHTGSLPIIASFLHPYLKNQVDLGKSLQMLAIHDIGETKLGDISTYLKNQSDRDEEYRVAINLIHPSQKYLFDEFEKLETLEAKFAKAVDKIAPILVDYITPPEITIRRFEIQLGKKPEEIVPMIETKKSSFMQFDGFMASFHAVLTEVLRAKLAS